MAMRPRPDPGGTRSNRSVRAEPVQGEPIVERILDAAERCFEVSGLRRASMVQVAAAAGLSRRTLYNHFENKADLVAAFVERQARRAYGAASAKLDRATAPDRLLEEAELALLRASRSRRYTRILLDPAAFDLTAEVIRGSERIRSIARNYWMPCLDAIAAAGRLRPGLDRQRAVDWLQLLHLMVVAHPELFGDGQELRRIYADFVTPGILRPTGRRTAQLG
jgi:AcrR family transcriptional regulator